MEMNYIYYNIFKINNLQLAINNLQYMRSLLFLTFSLFFVNSLQAQEINGRSPEYNFNITKDPPKPPYLEFDESSILVTDGNTNSSIDANESVDIKLTLKNSGSGEGVGLKLKVQETTSAPGLTFDKIKNLENIKVGGSQTIQIPIQSNMNIKEGKAIFRIEVEEPNGFGSDPITVEFVTRAFVDPKVVITDYSLQSVDGNRIQKRKSFDVQVMVQNIGEGIAEQVNINLIIPQNMFCLSSNENTIIQTLKRGEGQTITYNLVVNQNYESQSIPVKLEVKEKYGKYGQNKDINLTLNQEIANRELVIQPVKDNNVKPEIVVGTLSSGIDKNIPVSGKKYPSRFALIIGNENYTDFQTGLNSEMNVDFARNDASVFRQYAENVLGIESRNIIFLTDATSAKMNQEISKVEAILKRVGSKAELIVYYAGHGLPDEISQNAFLIPVDVSGSNLSSAIKMNDLYKRFAETGAGRITIFLDACFSGGGRNSGLLAARSVKIKPKPDAVTGNVVVFTASKGEQSALSLNREKHGLFTYFLIKKLQETNGNLTYNEMWEYLKSEVSIESLRTNSKEQDPDVLISPDIQDVWKNWMINP